MKKLSIILAAMLVCSVMQAQLVEGWQEIPTGVTENLFGVACLDKNEVVACGENGKILKTVDGGETWMLVEQRQPQRRYRENHRWRRDLAGTPQHGVRAFAMA